jgi:hypothetical protein
MSLGDYTALDTRLATIGGISTRLFSSLPIVHRKPEMLSSLNYLVSADDFVSSVLVYSCLHLYQTMRKTDLEHAGSSALLTRLVPLMFMPPPCSPEIAETSLTKGLPVAPH